MGSKSLSIVLSLHHQLREAGQDFHLHLLMFMWACYIACTTRSRDPDPQMAPILEWRKLLGRVLTCVSHEMMGTPQCRLSRVIHSGPISILPVSVVNLR